MASTVSREDVLGMNGPSERFMCALEDNIAGIDFLAFTISDYETKEVIFDVARDSAMAAEADLDLGDEESMRTITYSFPADVLRLPAITTDLVFSVGPEPVQNFSMVERHYFRGELLKSFDFDFGFCMPGTTNTWQANYEVPVLPEDKISDIVAHPYEVVSDSFYFANDRLIIHNKALYRYHERGARAEEKLDTGRPKGEAKLQDDEDLRMMAKLSE